MTTINFTDSLFADVLSTISVDGTLFFTPKQFAYLLDRKLKNKINSVAKRVSIYLFSSIILGIISIFYGKFHWVVFGVFGILSSLSLREERNSPIYRRSYQQVAIVLIFVPLIVMISNGVLRVVHQSWVTFILAILIGLPVILNGFLQQQKVNKSYEEFLVELSQITQWLQKWQSVHGNINRLLPPPQATLAASPNPSVTAYGFDRLVVCNRPTIAQILLENQFHFEHNCAILSITGYPENVCDTVLEMMHRNPYLMVYAFHDASPDGVNLIHRLRSESRWFPDNTVKIIDVGLLPRQVIASRHKIFVRQSVTAATAAHELSPATRQSLTASELAWLDAGNYTELESFTPQRLIRILQHSITISQSSDFENDSNITLWSNDEVSLIDGFEGGRFS
jgi:hypothetical protein